MTYHIVATEGATVDGRNISAVHLEQMAKNYDPKKYGARIWLEHMRGLYADSSFAALGDVTSLRTDKNAEGKTVLLAQLAPTPGIGQNQPVRAKKYLHRLRLTRILPVAVRLILSASASPTALPASAPAVSNLPPPSNGHKPTSFRLLRVCTTKRASCHRR